MSAASPDTVEGLERLAPSSAWTRQALPGLDAELVVLPTKLPNRFVVRRGRAAIATLEAAAPLFAPLDAARAARLVDALERGELASAEAPERLRAAGFTVMGTSQEMPLGALRFDRLELRSAQSAPCLVAVRIGIDEAGRVDRRERVIAELPRSADADPVAASPAVPGSKTKRVDRSEEIDRFVSAVRGPVVGGDGAGR